MNTVIKFPTLDKTVVTADNEIIGRGVVWLISGNPDCESIGVYICTRQATLKLLPKFKDSQRQLYIWDYPKVSKETRDQVHEFIAEGWAVYFINITLPSSNGSLTLQKGEQNEPILVQPHNPLVTGSESITT